VNEDRLMIVEAVFNGLLSQDHLTQAEIDEFAVLVADAAMDKLMAEAETRGCSVFTGVEGDPIH